MGGNHSKKPFTQWDLIQFSNITGIPLSTVEQIYKEFLFSTGNENKMDKKQFRFLYKQMYSNNQNTLSFLSDEDLNKMSDHVFHIYDFDGTGKLTFEEFPEIYLMLNHYAGTLPDGKTHHNRFNYILDQYDPTSGIITRDYGEQIFNRLHQYENLSNWRNPSLKKSSNETNWETHWNKIDQGKEQFV